MKNTTPILSCRNLCVGYGRSRVLDGLDMRFYPGEFVSLLGPNGAGKTTLLRTLSRLQPALGGQILLKGRPLEDIPSPELARTMSVVLTVKHVPPLFQVYEFVAMGRYPYTVWTGRLRPEDDRAVADALEMVGAADLAFRDLDTLSDGEKQKIFIARALAQEPEIILLDEPTVHLDLKHRMEIMSILQRLCREKGITVLASLHDLEVAAKVSDRVALVREGGVPDCGPPEDVLDRETVSGLYEFSRAAFNPVLGNIEIRSRADQARVFVVGGMGSAAVLYRLLAKRGYDMATGILMENDIDAVVARSLGALCLIQDNPMAVPRGLIDNARAAMDACDLVVDAGFMVSDLNRANLDLLDHALAQGRSVFALDRGAPRPAYRLNPSLVRRAGRETLVADLMDDYLGQAGEKTA
ncbi:MAG: ABC transporter ATP-binding protein [Desulfobacter sp.]|nr:MAG: ABC transporter ATP-binding protein [Desulfobacter sp.]